MVGFFRLFDLAERLKVQSQVIIGTCIGRTKRDDSLKCGDRLLIELSAIVDGAKLKPRLSIYRIELNGAFEEFASFTVACLHGEQLTSQGECLRIVGRLG